MVEGGMVGGGSAAVRTPPACDAWIAAIREETAGWPGSIAKARV